MTTLLDALAARRASGSRPGQRTDEFRIALAIEGGGSRAAYSAGMALAIDEAGLTDCFDDVYGTSGGALNGAWLLTGEAQRWLRSWAWPEVQAARVTDPRRVFRGGPVVDLRRLVHHVYESITPMDFDAIVANPIRFHPMATDAATGKETDLAPYVVDRLSAQTALRASSCIPLLAGRPVRVGERRYVDGGLSEGVPYRTALAQGATHVLVLRTRRADQRAVPPSRLERVLLAPYFLRHGRAAGAAHVGRFRSYAADDLRLAAGTLADIPTLVEVRPPLGSPDVSRLSADLPAIDDAIERGRLAMVDYLDRLPA
ncbi:patatin-like phospholipase family protein [Nocardioides sp. QY071]|uniref:patatin-like phospholipase family protein n=1 Tax=Nocardioides sp. QY071 TaxID=3044187 RepID=UPI00249C891E|nr:patatin-like phospholipase family protein [Nocardioides sp. QY071]WGY01721.1 patatin-like phospholipase family protein [Nocardioides sp. QY071]